MQSIDPLYVHGARDPHNTTGAITTPIDQSATFVHIRASTKAIFIETPTNPMMQVTGIAAEEDLIDDLEAVLK